MHNAKCESCPYWATERDYPVGSDRKHVRAVSFRAEDDIRECRRHPPTGNIIAQQSLTGPVPAVFPSHTVTHRLHWCGEHPELRRADYRLRGAQHHASGNDVLELDRASGRFNRVPTPEEFQAILDASGGKVSTFDPRTGAVKPVMGEDDKG